MSSATGDALARCHHKSPVVKGKRGSPEVDSRRTYSSSLLFHLPPPPPLLSLLLFLLLPKLLPLPPRPKCQEASINYLSALTDVEVGAFQSEAAFVFAQAWRTLHFTFLDLPGHCRCFAQSTPGKIRRNMMSEGRLQPE
jgi:hypothetical protein